MSNSEQIEAFIEQAKNNDRLFASKLIINVLRNYIEAIICYVAINDGAKYIDTSTHRAINDKSIQFVDSNRSKYELITSLHDSINNAASHESVLIGDYAERLMLSYIPKLIKIKKYLYDRFSIVTIKNLKQFPLRLDESTKEYYEKIINVLQTIKTNESLPYTENFYILDKKEKYINGVSFFEYTLSVIDDNRDKADKIIAFSYIDIFDNYAVKIKSFDKNISIFGINTNVKIIVDYDIAIRGCEFRKLAKIIGVEATGFRYTDEYYRLMRIIKDRRLSLADVVRLHKYGFNSIINHISSISRETILKNILLKSREHINQSLHGINTLLYLLASMDNQVIERQIKKDNENQLNYSNLLLTSKVSPFDKTPFCANLRDSAINSKILFSTIELKGHEFELIKRELECYSNANGLLYCPDSIFENDDELVSKVEKLKQATNNYDPFVIEFAYDDQNNRYLFLKENEKMLVSIIKELQKYIRTESILDYRNYAINVINGKGIKIDDPKKEEALVKMFDKKSAFVVYGPAGTGKSYLANLALSLLNSHSVLCVSSTHASLQNLKRRIGVNYGKYVTVEKIAKDTRDLYKRYDFVIIDECSTISNRDMYRLLQNVSPKLLLLMGDVYQIESINFGNWFGLLRRFIPSDSYSILDNCFRTNTDVLKNFWGKVRDIQPGIHEYLKNYQISNPLDNSFFGKDHNEDSIILCLNYGGLFGINNINAMMQSKNTGKKVEFRQHIYKVGDPILFKESPNHNDVLYNNLKGKILDIEEFPAKITFTVRVKDNINILFSGQEYRNVVHDNGETILSFDVFRCSDKEIEDDIKPHMVVPFNVAYASSIHKAQGLEFEKVDIVISDEIKEVITHNIFYTAITRAVKELNIYWSPQCEQMVIDNFSIKNYKTDELILTKKYKELKSIFIKK